MAMMRLDAIVLAGWKRFASGIRREIYEKSFELKCQLSPRGKRRPNGIRSFRSFDDLTTLNKK